jgi:hypothetical protein
VFPYETRLRWLLSSRYGHILRALALTPHPRDSILEERAASLRRWDRTRTTFMVFLYLGFAGTAIAIGGNFVPGLRELAPVLVALIRYVGTLTGLLTLAYLFLTRLLSQLEADILMLLVANARK